MLHSSRQKRNILLSEKPKVKSRKENNNIKQLVKTRCRRCGKELYTLANPINGSLETMHKYQGICRDCISNKENLEMLMDIGKDIQAKYLSGNRFY
ncbi:DUF2688 domain-containing protein [Butyrivibrio sp. WCD3002]|uniref:DUF2688 domain-containing protein n=1 Tax=Butyrivibrio sp. WCD3002 TaxID=1280676 RepID=UPI003FA42308